MTKSQDRVAARRVIQERVTARRREREQKEQRIGELAVAVNVALNEGRRALRRAEHEAGAALSKMIGTEGVGVFEAIDWIGDPTLTAREITRLRNLAGPSPETGPEGRAR